MPSWRTAVRHAAGRVRRFGHDHLFDLKRRWLFEADLRTIKRTEAKLPVSIRAGTRADVLHMRRIEHGYDAEDRRFSLERLAAGDRLFVGEHDHRIVVYGWSMLDQMEVDDDAYAPLPPGVAYIYKLFTVRSQRGLGLMKQMYAEIADRLVDAGYSHAVLWIYPENRPSIRATLAVGFHRIGSIYNLSLLGRHWTRLRARMQA